jgi:hypothetical protein
VGPVVISEINYQPPDLTYPRARVNNEVDEYIELHNTSGVPVPLMIRPIRPTPRFRDALISISQGTTIAAGGCILVVASIRLTLRTRDSSPPIPSPFTPIWSVEW